MRLAPDGCGNAVPRLFSSNVYISHWTSCSIISYRTAYRRRLERERVDFFGGVDFYSTVSVHSTSAGIVDAVRHGVGGASHHDLAQVMFLPRGSEVSAAALSNSRSSCSVAGSGDRSHQSVVDRPTSPPSLDSHRRARHHGASTGRARRHGLPPPSSGSITALVLPSWERGGGRDLALYVQLTSPTGMSTRIASETFTGPDLHLLLEQCFRLLRMQQYR